jgi:hypothetical protein
LGDDLYSDYNTCKAVLDAEYHFIFTCKEASHPWLSETVRNSFLEERRKREWNGRTYLVYTCRWVNGVPIRYEENESKTLMVNYFEMSIWNENLRKMTFFNSWVTDKVVTTDNVKHLVDCARARWKIENEHNNVLKNHGYNLEHNFGHGEEHANEIYCVLNLLAFLMHGLMQLLDEDYQKARASFRRREAFFEALRFSFRRFLHKSWEDFMIFIPGDEPDG